MITGSGCPLSLQVFVVTRRFPLGKASSTTEPGQRRRATLPRVTPTRVESRNRRYHRSAVYIRWNSSVLPGTRRLAAVLGFAAGSQEQAQSYLNNPEFPRVALCGRASGLLAGTGYPGQLLAQPDRK